MAFIVEDGTGIVDANSYTTIVFANDYFSERGNSVWATYTDTQKQEALIKATDYIELRYRDLFKGKQYLSTQGLSFPRLANDTEALDTFIYDTVDSTLIIGVAIPKSIQRATCEYAARTFTGALVSDNLNQEGVSTRVKIGQIEKEITYPTQSRPAKQFASYPAADSLLKRYLKSTSSMVVR